MKRFLTEMTENSDNKITQIGGILNDRRRPLKARFRALFSLRSIGGPESVREISRCFSDDSALLKHELAYCLGQIGDSSAVPVLTQVLRNLQEHPMVRHEAGEALGAVGLQESLPVLCEYATDPVVEVAETCQLAVQRIKWSSQDSKEDLIQNPYLSVDPTPPSAAQKDVEELEIILTDTSLPLWDRYRAMFTLRNLGTKDCVRALAKGLSCEDSALFRHEVAYVLGQIQSKDCVKELRDRLIDPSENCMVRHECAEALGAIGSEEAEIILGSYLNDEEAVVRESCEVALDMCDYENSAEFQYANSVIDSK